MVNLRILIALLLFVSISCACFYGGEFDENFDFCKGIFKTHLGLGLLTAGIISMAIANADGKYPMYASVIATSSLAYNSALFISRGEKDVNIRNTCVFATLGMIGTTVISSWADEFNTRLRSVSELFILGGASLAGIESYQGQHVNELPRAAVQLNRMGYICMALATIGQGKGEETLNLRGIMSSMKSCLRIGLIEDLICKWGAAGESSRSIKLVALMASIAGFYFFKIGALISWINFFNPLNHLHSIRRAMHEEPIE